MDVYHIRAAMPADLEIMLRHRQRMFEDMGRTDVEGLAAMRASAAGLLRRRLADGTYLGWLVETADGRVVAGGGIILLDVLPGPTYPDPRRGWVVNMYTEPEHRRRGLARQLLVTMITWSRARGMPRLFLHASPDGRPLYEQLGFVPTSEMSLTL